MAKRKGKKPSVEIGQVRQPQKMDGVKSLSFRIETKPDFEKMANDGRQGLVQIRDALVTTAMERASTVSDPQHALTVVRIIQLSQVVDTSLMKVGISEAFGGLITKIDGKEVKRGGKPAGKSGKA